mgnify:CR=1 FL=1
MGQATPVRRDGRSRKPDHDRVNDFLARTNQYLLGEAAKFLDPTLDDESVRAEVDRVVDTVTRQGIQEGYFTEGAEAEDFR